MNEEDFRVDFPTEIVEEGEVRVLVPKLEAFVKSPSDYAPSKAPVFYNPIMELNRDIAVLALQAYQRRVNREISVCEPLAGCGIRGIRFAVEVSGVQKVVINDINENAFKLANLNVHLTKLDGSVIVKNKDANLILSGYAAPRKRFDVIDVDPFGSPTPYLDSTIRALRNGGLVALTATDMAPLCGIYPEVCMRKYGGKSLRTEYCHELAVRLLTGCLAKTAAKYGIGIKIVFSHSTDHYVRVYAETERSAKKANETVRKMGYILHCFKCFHRETIQEPFLIGHSEKCVECGSKLSVAGPLWLGEIFDEDFCKLMMEEIEKRSFRLKDRIRKILNLARLEAKAPITYYVIDKMCDTLSLRTPPLKKVFEALKEMGFQAIPTHFNSRGVRTDAPAMVVQKILKQINS